MDKYTYYFNDDPSARKQVVEEYKGETAITLFCTQLNPQEFPKRSQQNKVLNDWIKFLEEHPKALKKVHCTSRMNQRLFNALCCQTELEELYLKWGVYPDLSAIRNLKKLKYLHLCSGASAKDISPISELSQLEVLNLVTVGVTDYSSLGQLTQLKQLGLHSGMDNTVKVESLAFLR